jgi:hypothetical protein
MYHFQNVNNKLLLKKLIRHIGGMATGYQKNFMNWFKMFRFTGDDLYKIFTMLSCRN